MIEIIPNYYSEFKCIADKCQHTCCKGWEIDIDSETYDKYANMSGELGDEIRANIDINEETASFRLVGDEERCPFLNSDNLCRLILACGENVLCNICKDHPRFRNFRSDRTEIGLGLACEEACRLILNYNEPFCLVGDFIPSDEVDEDERYVYESRDEDIRKVTNRNMPLSKRIECDYEVMDSKSRALLFADLEILDETWLNMLKELSRADIVSLIPDTIQFENLISYLLFRHPEANIIFAIESAHLIADLCQVTALPLEEVARMFSSEIEYSDINIDTLIEALDCYR